MFNERADNTLYNGRQLMAGKTEGRILLGCSRLAKQRGFKDYFLKLYFSVGYCSFIKYQAELSSALKAIYGQESDSDCGYSNVNISELH